MRPGYERVAQSYMDDLSYHDTTNAYDASPVSMLVPSARPSPAFPRLAASNFEALAERGKLRCVDNNGIQMDMKNQFQLDLDKIRTGEDTRTTLMIKNIPNK